MATLTTEQVARVARWKATDQTIVFTNGVFDLLHAGHLHQLKAAALQGDVLIVGVNSDSSVKSLGKGEDRPVIKQAERLALLAELRCVDMAVLFDEPTPLELIKLIVPDVLVKGEDYRGREVVGRDVVEAAGGQVVLVPLLEGFSTTELLARIRGAD